jgi:hypothetical protein
VSFECFTHQHFILEGSVDFCCIKEGHAELKSTVDGGNVNLVWLILACEEVGHAHAAEANA